MQPRARFLRISGHGAPTARVGGDGVGRLTYVISSLLRFVAVGMEWGRWRTMIAAPRMHLLGPPHCSRGAPTNRGDGDGLEPSPCDLFALFRPRPVAWVSATGLGRFPNSCAGVVLAVCGHHDCRALTNRGDGDGFRAWSCM